MADLTMTSCRWFVQLILDRFTVRNLLNINFEEKAFNLLHFIRTLLSPLVHNLTSRTATAQSLSVFHVSNVDVRVYTQHTVLFDTEWWTKGNSALLRESCCSVWSDICKRPWEEMEYREERGMKKTTRDILYSKCLAVEKKEKGEAGIQREQMRKLVWGQKLGRTLAWKERWRGRG